MDGRFFLGRWKYIGFLRLGKFLRNFLIFCILSLDFLINHFLIETSSGRAMIHAQEKLGKVSFGDNFRPAQAIPDSLLEKQGNNDFRIFMLAEMP